MTDRLTQLLKLHQADPADPFCTYGIALEHAKVGQLDEAIRWLDQTLGLDDHYGYAYYQKAKALMEKGESDAARSVLEQGIAIMRQAGGADNLHAAEEMQGLMDML